MGRIRSIKPEFCVSETLADCSRDARLLFLLMWCFCDDYGNHPAKLVMLKAEVFPTDPLTKGDMQRLVGELLKHDLLIEYRGDDGATYWHVKGWHHQLITKRSQRRFPAYSEGVRGSPGESGGVMEDSVTSPGESGGVMVGSGGDRDLEGIGSSNGSKIAIASALACTQQQAVDVPAARNSKFVFPVKHKTQKTWALPIAKLEQLRTTFVGVDIEDQLAKARQWCVDNPRKQKTPTGMAKFLTAWMSRANDRGHVLTPEQQSLAEYKRIRAAENSRAEAERQREAAARAAVRPTDIVRETGVEPRELFRNPRDLESRELTPQEFTEQLARIELAYQRSNGNGKS